MRWFSIFVVLVVGCAMTGTRETLKQVQGDIVGNRGVAQDSIVFGNPIIDFCLDKNNNLLLLDASQEKILALNLESARIDTIILPQKIYFLKGIATDGIFIYLYTDNSLWRYDRTNQVLKTIIESANKIKINDIAITSSGEIFVSDDLNNQIVFVNSLANLTKFNIDIKDLFVPAGFYYDEQISKLYLINKAQNRIEAYSRIGNFISHLSLPDRSCSKITISKDQILVWGENKNFYYQRNRQSDWVKKVLSNKITDIVAINNLLYILDSTKGIFIYK